MAQPQIILQTGPHPRGAVLTSGTEPVDFAVLQNGGLGELVEDPENPSRTLLLVWQDGQVNYATEIREGNRILRPLPRKEVIGQHIQLPRRVEPYRSLESLLCELEALIERCVKLPHGYSTILAHFILYTWLADRLSEAVYLFVIGATEHGKTTLLKTLRLLCRRALLTGDLTSAAFLDACNRWKPTLLLDEEGAYGNRRYLDHLLRIGTTADSVAMRKNRAYSPFGAKVISFLELPDDPQLRRRGIILPMTQAETTNLAKPTDPKITTWAERLRAQLLQFRLNHYHRIKQAVVPGSENLRPGTRDLLSSLAAPLAEEPLHQRLLLEFLRHQEGLLQEPLPPPQNAVLGALFYILHVVPRQETQIVMVAELTKLANQLLTRAGERYRLTPKATGSALTLLGILNHQRTNRGYKVWLRKEDEIRMHQLLKNHGIDHFGELFHQELKLCRLCRENTIRFDLAP